MSSRGSCEAQRLALGALQLQLMDHPMAEYQVPTGLKSEEIIWVI